MNTLISIASITLVCIIYFDLGKEVTPNQKKESREPASISFNRPKIVTAEVQQVISTVGKDYETTNQGPGSRSGKQVYEYEDEIPEYVEREPELAFDQTAAETDMPIEDNAEHSQM
jgi:hypothetical protein